MTDEQEDSFARMQRLYREECIRLGTYKPFTDEELERAVAKWRAKCNEPSHQRQGRKRRKTS